MKRRTLPTLLTVLTVIYIAALPAAARAFVADSDRDRDGLSGPVRRVKTETSKLANKGGKVVEGQRVVLESVAYDVRGVKIESAYFPLPGATLTGKEVYKYDDRGNIIEMTLLSPEGSLLSKEVYTYEFDAFGNWTKMTTSVAVIEGGKVSYEPTEVTYRTISYYLDEATLARMSQPAAAAPAQTAAPQNNLPHNSAPAAAKSVQPVALPSGASLVKASTTPASTVSLPGDMQRAGAGVKVEVEPPPPPAANRPAPRPLLKPISGGVLNGKAVSLPKPVYPPAAKSANAQGTVTVDVVIDESGKVISAKAVDGSPMLRMAAQQAAQGARFSPTLLSGQPVKVAGQITYTFTLK